MQLHPDSAYVVASIRTLTGWGRLCFRPWEMATLSSVFTLWANPLLGKVSTCSAQGRNLKARLYSEGPDLAILISEIVKSHVLEREWAGSESLC